MVAVKCVVLVLALAISSALASPTAGRTSVTVLDGKYLAASGFSKSRAHVPLLARQETAPELLSLKQDSNGSGVYESCPGGIQNANVASSYDVCRTCFASRDPVDCPLDCCLVPVGNVILYCEVNGWYLSASENNSGLLQAASNVRSRCLVAATNLRFAFVPSFCQQLCSLDHEQRFGIQCCIYRADLIPQIQRRSLRRGFNDTIKLSTLCDPVR
jgi:hypothetical protein